MLLIYISTVSRYNTHTY